MPPITDRDDQYAGLVDEYARSKATDIIPFRHAEEYTVTKYLAVSVLGADSVDPQKDYELTDFEDLKPLKGKRIVDLACGYGHYSRKWCELYGARSVTASDLSEDQIAAARKTEAEAPLNIQYAVADARSPDILEIMNIAPDNLVDAVTAVWLDLYMTSSDELETLLKAVHSMLKPGGVFVQACLCSKNEIVQTHKQGVPISGVRLTSRDTNDSSLDKLGTVELKNGPGDDDWFCSNVRFWHAETYKTVAKAAGFGEPEINEWELSPNDRLDIGEEIHKSIMECYGSAMVLRKPLE